MPNIFCGTSGSTIWVRRLLLVSGCLKYGSNGRCLSCHKRILFLSCDNTVCQGRVPFGDSSFGRVLDFFLCSNILSHVHSPSNIFQKRDGGWRVIALLSSNRGCLQRIMWGIHYQDQSNRCRVFGTFSMDGIGADTPCSLSTKDLLWYSLWRDLVC